MHKRTNNVSVIHHMQNLEFTKLTHEENSTQDYQL